MKALLNIAKAADEQISAIHAAFGAPGDYGYESREGKALYALYKFQVELRSAIAEATSKSDVVGEQDKYKNRPYGEWCRNPAACAGKGYCPLDPTCGD